MSLAVRIKQLRNDEYIAYIHLESGKYWKPVYAVVDSDRQRLYRRVCVQLNNMFLENYELRM